MVGISNTRTPFIFATEEDLSMLIDEADSANTKKQILYAVNRMKMFASSAGMPPIETMSETQLDSFLAKFYAGLRKEDGSYYMKKSMHGIHYGLRRHFLAVRSIDIPKVDLFVQSNKIFKAVKLKKEGKWLVEHKNPISKEDMAKIFAVIDITTPQGLQDKVFIDIMMYFANRGRENLRDMKITDFVIQKKVGLQYIVHRDTLTKARREKDDEGYSGHMYEIPGSAKCPVSLFVAYKAVLNPKQECMWQRPKPNAPSEGPWYTNAPLGINTLGAKVKTISTKAGCSQKYTNHSPRATTVTVLDDAGFASRDLMAITGHKSESSLKHYARTSNGKKKEMSTVIAARMQENDPLSCSVSETTSEDLLDGLPLLTDSQEKMIPSE